MRVEVLSVSHLDEARQVLLGFEVESPVPGTSTDEPVVTVAGWALGNASPVLSVEIAAGRAVIRAEPLRPRWDVPEQYPDIPSDTKTGFGATVGVIGLEREFELELRVVLENGDRVPIAIVRGRRELLRPSPADFLRPIRVTCMRRSGSTWLMHLLGTHPEVVVFPAYPYESRPGRYWGHMLRVLAEPSAPLGSWTRMRYTADPRVVGHNPYYESAARDEPGLRDWYGDEYVTNLADLCRRSTEGWYRKVAEAEGKPGASRFSEKHIVQIDDSIDVWPELYSGGSDILLVRDFRDMAYSMMSFDRSHGHKRFDGPPGEPAEAYVRRVMTLSEELRHTWAARTGAHSVRYEDLVAHPVDILAGVLEHVGLPTPRATTEGIVRICSEPMPRTRRHVTSPTVEESVGRWQEEANQEFRDLCDELLGDALRAFEYD
jgi:hypothetical protein